MPAKERSLAVKKCSEIRGQCSANCRSSPSTITQHVTSLSRMEDYDRICHLSNWRWFTIRWYTLVYALKYKQLLSALLKVTQSFIWCTRQNIKICKRLREKHPPYLFFLKETRNPNHWTEDSRRRSYDVTSVSRMETSDDRLMAAIIDRHFESGIVHVQSPQKSGSASLPRAMKSGNCITQ